MHAPRYCQIDDKLKEGDVQDNRNYRGKSTDKEVKEEDSQLTICCCSQLLAKDDALKLSSQPTELEISTPPHRVDYADQISKLLGGAPRGRHPAYHRLPMDLESC